MRIQHALADPSWPQSHFRRAVASALHSERYNVESNDFCCTGTGAIFVPPEDLRLRRVSEVIPVNREVVGI